MDGIDWHTVLDPERNGVLLRAGCHHSAMVLAEERLDLPLPGQIASFYRFTNGFHDTTGQWDVAWPLSRLVDQNLDRWNDQVLPLPRDLLAFGDDGAGDWFCVPAAGEDPSVHHFAWIESARTMLAQDLPSFWLRWLSGDLTA